MGSNQRLPPCRGGTLPTELIARIYSVNILNYNTGAFRIQSQNISNCIDTRVEYVYPAIFSPEEKGSFSIYFPDIEGCYTQGDSLEDGIEMAEDALCLVLYDYEVNNKAIPAPSAPKDIKAEGADIITLIKCDTLEYKRFYDSHAVKKTLTIPNWLNVEAEKAGINFSATLQNAIKERLGL